MDSDGIIEKVPAHGDHLFVLLQKLMDHRVSVLKTRLLLISSLFERHGLCPMSSFILIQWVAQNSSLFVTYRALTDKYQQKRRTVAKRHL